MGFGAGEVRERGVAAETVEGELVGGGVELGSGSEEDGAGARAEAKATQQYIRCRRVENGCGASESSTD